MKKEAKILKNILLFNVRTLLVFFFAYTISAKVIMTMLEDFLFHKAIYFAGLDYIGQNNLGRFMLAPTTWVYLLAIVVIILSAIIFELAGMIILYDYSHKKIRIGFLQLMKEEFDVVKGMCRTKNLFLIPILLLFVPFIGLSCITNMSSDLTISGFIMNFISKYPVLYGLLAVIYILLYIYLIWGMFISHEICIRKKGYREAAKASKSILKGHFVQTVAMLAASDIVITLILAIIILGCSMGASLLCMMLGFRFAKSEYYALLVLLAIVIYFYPFILVAKISTMYYLRIGEEMGTVEQEANTFVPGYLKGVVSVVIAICTCVFLLSFVVDGISSDILLSRPVIGAHRGSSVKAPENTMPAFKLAIEEGVSDWIELDVHQTVDGYVIVSHDDNIQRVAGIDACVHEMTYADLMKLDVGSWFSPEFKGLHFSTLDEVLDVCKDKINVQIEIKPTPYDDALPEQVADIIRAHGMEEECMVISLKDKPLKTIKEYAPDIKTGYCMIIADGNLTEIDFSDDVTIEEQNATESLIYQMHKQNKKVFVWTINSTENIQHLVDIGVDGIITDNPTLISKTLDEEVDYIGGFAKILRLIMY